MHVAKMQQFLLFTIVVASMACSPQSRGPGDQRAAPLASHAPQTAPSVCRPVVVTGPEGGAVDIVHGVAVADPFRWLEDRNSPRTRAWVDAEDRHTRATLQTNPLRPTLVAELERDRSQSSWRKLPQLRNGKYLYQRRDEGSERGAILEYDPVGHQENIVLDLDKMDVFLRYWKASPDGTMLAAVVSKNGSDAVTIRIFDIRTRKWLSDEVSGGRFGYPEWAPPAKGFYYTWSPSEDGIEAKKRTAQSEIRFHAVGTVATKDQVVRPSTQEDGVFEFPGISDDGRWLVAGRVRSTPDNDFFIFDRTAPGKSSWKRVTPLDPHTRYGIIFVKGGLIVWADEETSGRRAYRVDPKRPGRELWKDVAADRPGEKLVDISAVGDYISYEYARDAETVFEIRRGDGSLVKSLTPPSPGTLLSLTSDSTSAEASIAFATYTTPYQAYLLRPPAFDLVPFPPAFHPVGDDRYVTEKVFYTSPDGTRAPIFIVRSRSTPPHQPAPLILYGYGAFGDNVFPQYRRGLRVWLDRGGVYAEAVIRGGGEYGQSWHDAGRGRNRKNVYDDFLAAAQHLVSDKWTAPDKFLLRGVSSGGLLVAVSETERPDLFRGIIAHVPLTDMARYPLGKDNGTLWVGEYGSPSVAEDFEQLLRYSPYHRVKNGVHYPWTFVVGTNDDDRVDPMHGRKFVAALQAADPCGTALLRNERDAAHGGPTSATAWVQEEADIYSFAFAAIGYKGR